MRNTKIVSNRKSFLILVLEDIGANRFIFINIELKLIL